MYMSEVQRVHRLIVLSINQKAAAKHSMSRWGQLFEMHVFQALRKTSISILDTEEAFY